MRMQFFDLHPHFFMDLPFLTGQPFLPPRTRRSRRKNPYKISAFSAFVYFVPFVVRLFPVRYGRAFFICPFKSLLKVCVPFTSPLKNSGAFSFFTTGAIVCHPHWQG